MFRRMWQGRVRRSCDELSANVAICSDFISVGCSEQLYSMCPWHSRETVFAPLRGLFKNRKGRAIK